MKKINTLILVVVLIFAVSCKKDKKEADNGSDTQTEAPKDSDSENKERTNGTTPTVSDGMQRLKVSLEAKSNSSVSGNAIFTDDKGVVTMIAVMGGLSEGTHAIHLHEKADCSSDDGKSTGGHWNPTAQAHGKWGAESGYHKGDIGNFTADANGNGTVTFITNEWCIGCGDPNKDILGKAIIVHQGTDDFASQPSGDAGSRVSCGGVIQ